MLEAGETAGLLRNLELSFKGKQISLKIDGLLQALSIAISVVFLGKLDESERGG